MSGSTILVLGLAREGESLARYFAARGERVLVTDSAPHERLAARAASLLQDSPLPRAGCSRLQRSGYPLGAGSGVRVPPSIELFTGRDYPELVDRADRFFVSPGIPEDNPVYRAAREAGLPIESMTTLFFDLCPVPIVGITGSSGKTTTTGLIGHILRTAGRDVLVGGNIGDPMLDLLARVNRESIVVLELSSFQLSILRRSPHIAVITNISPNHLDRHATMENYVAAKRHIVAYQSASDYVVLNAADPTTSGFAAASPAQPRWFGLEVNRGTGASVREGVAGLVNGERFEPVIDAAEIPLLGSHNLENVLAALAATAVLDVEAEEMAAAVRTFQPPAHRLQLVGEHAGVRYIDDSIATSPARAAVALRALAPEGYPPVVLIAGGRDKRLPWEEFAALAAERTHALILIGEAAEQIKSAVAPFLQPGVALLQRERVLRAGSLLEAVELASTLARPGDVVLLSPGCASYDMFSDYEERGAAFARAVERLNAPLATSRAPRKGAG